MFRFASSGAVTKHNLSQATLLHIVSHGKQPQRKCFNGSVKSLAHMIKPTHIAKMSKPAHIARIALEPLKNERVEGTEWTSGNSIYAFVMQIDQPFGRFLPEASVALESHPLYGHPRRTRIIPKITPFNLGRISCEKRKPVQKSFNHLAAGAFLSTLRAVTNIVLHMGSANI